MKTILHVIDTTGPGGAETVFIDLATRMPADAYRPIVLIRGKGWVYEELRRRGIEPLLLDAVGSFNWSYLAGLVRLIGQEKIDLVQSHLLGANVYCSLAGLLTGKPVVATFHGVVDIGENERFRRLKFALINRGARCVTAVSGKLRRDIIDKTFIEEHKISVIHNGIETDRFQRPRSTAYRKIYGWDADDTVIGSLGNIRSAKGYDVLLQAAALLANDSHKYRFLIAGAGGNTLHEKLLVLRKNLGLERVVHFTGFNDDPAGFLSNLDLFLLPSTSEGFSIATIQAMSARLPVIVTRSGGPEEIVEHGKTGWVVAAGDPDAIASAISKLAADRGLCENLSRHAKDHVEKTFDLNSMLSEYRKIYDGLLAV